MAVGVHGQAVVRLGEDAVDLERHIDTLLPGADLKAALNHFGRLVFSSESVALVIFEILVKFS